MKNIENLKSAWKQNKQENNQPLTERQIMYYLKQQSTDISALFRKGLFTDIIFKSALLLSSIGLIFIYQSQTPVLGLGIALALLTVFFAGIQLYYYKQVQSIDNPAVDTQTLLKTKIDYFHQKYVKAVFLSALSSPIMVLCGFLYYYYFKYGFVKPMDTVDIIVMGSFLALSFVISLAAYLFQFKFHVRQLESSLNDMVEGDIDEKKIQTARNQRIVLVIAMSLILVIGLLVFAYIVL